MRVLVAYVGSFTLHAALLGAAAWVAATAMTTVDFRLQRGRSSIELQASIAQPQRKPADAIKLADPPPISKRDDRPAAAPIEPSEFVKPRRLPTSPTGRRPSVVELPTLPMLDEVVVTQLPDAAEHESPSDVATLPQSTPTRRPTEAKVDDSVEVPPSAASQTSTQSSGSEVDELPTSLPTNPSPARPADAVGDRQERIVTLIVLVGVDGRPRQVLIETSSGSVPHDHSVLRTVRDLWRFSPAKSRGIAVEQWTRVRFRFEPPLN